MNITEPNISPNLLSEKVFKGKAFEIANQASEIMRNRILDNIKN